MPFIAPVIAAAIGAGVIGQALIGAALSFAMAAAARALGPKPRELETSGRGMRLSLRLDPNAAREVIFGEAAVAGTLVYHQVFGPNGNDSIDLVFAVADHECDSLQGVYVNGTAVTWNSGTGAVTEFPGMVIKFYSGAYSQTASADIIAQSGGNWTTNHRGRGVAYVHARIAFDQNLYRSGLPKLLFVMRGAKLYDWRLDTTVGGSGSHRWGDPTTYAWSANPVVQLYNWRRGIYVNSERVAGMATPAAAMPYDAWTAAANACDESVSKLPSGTEPRYRAHGVISTRTTHRDVITDLLTAMAGREIDSGGTLVPLPGVSQSPVMTITDADIMADADVVIKKKRPRSQLVNAVFGSYHSPEHVYESIAAPPRISPADEASDGGVRLEESYALDYVTSASQAQRVLEIMRRRGRQQGEARLRLRPRFAVLEAGDWVTWNSDRYGYSSQQFEVVSVSVSPDWSTTVTLRETAAAVYSWTPATDELDPAAPETVSPGGPTLTEIAGLAVSTTTVSSGATQRPGLTATWTAVSDRTVTGILIEYRQVGDTGALEYRVFSPGAGTATWINGVMGGADYEIRAKPITEPERPVDWTSWVEATTSTAGVLVESVPGLDAVAPENLTPQTRFELSLTTSIDAVQGGFREQEADAYSWAQRAGEEAIAALIEGYSVRALVRTETIERSTETSALASQITTAVTTIDEHTASITSLLSSVDGINASWGVAINIDGQVVGLVKLDGSASESLFEVVADKFQVAQPSTTGGDPVPVFQIANVGGTPKIVFRGDMISDGSITVAKLSVSQLSAIVANLGTITAGLLRSSDNKMRIDLDNKSIVMEV